MAVRFDAANDRVTWTGTAPTPSSGLTITLWAYVSVDRDDYSALVRMHASAGATTIINFATNNDGVTPNVFTAGGTAAAPQALPVAGWARVALTITGSTATIYVAHGAAGATQSAAGTVGGSAGSSPTSGYTLAGRSIGDSAEWFNGRLAHVRIWSAVLTQTEIEAEWLSTTAVRTAALFAAYPLSTATDLADASGNGRNLAAGASAVTTEDDPPIPTTVDGTAAYTLPSLAASATGNVQVAGTVGVALPALQAAMEGGSVLAAVMGASLPPVEVAGEGALTTAATLTAALPSLTAVLAGTVNTPVAGTLALLLPALSLGVPLASWPPAIAADTGAAHLVTGPTEPPWLAVS